VEVDRESLRRLGKTVDEVVEFYRGIGDASVLVNTTWTARDVLVHLVFWHESFARNVRDLAGGVKPTPLKGTYAQLGRQAAAEARGLCVEELLVRLAAAQGVVERCVFEPGVVSIPYKVGSRPYGPAEHLSVVNEHVAAHLGKVRLAYAVQAASFPRVD